MTKVLLTGGSGFIAAHVLEQLLQRGYEVITTVRSEEKASKIKEAHPGAKLATAIVPDIAVPNAFDDVLKSNTDIEYVQHTASPFHYNVQDPKTDLLDPAITGTTSVLRGIKSYAPQVKRVIVTSSFAAILSEAGMADPTKKFSEADWNPNTYEDGLKGPPGVSYRVSKTLAERAAWDFVDKEKPNFDVATINPPLVLGPVVHHLTSLASVNTSNERFVRLAEGKWADEIPPTGTYLWVDVRDVADAHVEAMARPEAGGKRFFTTAGHFGHTEVLDIALKNFPWVKEKVPNGAETKAAPGAKCPAPGEVYGYDNSRASEVLGIQWISLEKSVVDTIKGLQKVPGASF